LLQRLETDRVQLCGATGPIEQLDSELSLKPLDLGTHSRLRQADPVAGSREGSLAGNGNEGLELFDHSQISVVVAQKI